MIEKAKGKRQKAKGQRPSLSVFYPIAQLFQSEAAFTLSFLYLLSTFKVRP
jgi:hypothetical protein